MSLSNQEKTNRMIKAATRTVYAREHALDATDQEPPAPLTNEQIIELVEEEIGWSFTRSEADLALYTWYRQDQTRQDQTPCEECGMQGEHKLGCSRRDGQGLKLGAS